MARATPPPPRRPGGRLEAKGRARSAKKENEREAEKIKGKQLVTWIKAGITKGAELHNAQVFAAEQKRPRPPLNNVPVKRKRFIQQNRDIEHERDANGR